MVAVRKSSSAAAGGHALLCTSQGIEDETALCFAMQSARLPGCSHLTALCSTRLVGGLNDRRHTQSEIIDGYHPLKCALRQTVELNLLAGARKDGILNRHDLIDRPQKRRRRHQAIC